MRATAPLLALALAGCAQQDLQPLPGVGGNAVPLQDNPYEDADSLDPADANGQCGETHIVDMTLSGYALDEQWRPMANTEVWLEERNWTPRNRHGTGVTDDSGRFEFELHDVPIVEDCWGIGPQFYLMSASGVRTCEVPANMHIVIAWLDESLYADISGYPCVLQAD